MRLPKPFIHPQACVIGLVELSPGCSIWPGAVLRADMNSIRLGRAVNIQDGTVIHTDSERGVTIGDFTLVGHKAMLHGCRIGRAVLIGTGSTVHDDAEIEDGAMIMANCVIRGKKKIPARALVLPAGDDVRIIPGKAKTLMTIAGSLEYVALAKRYQKGVFGPFRSHELRRFEMEAKKIFQEIFPALSP
ncbi:MAG: gamma carbonic anhydrase family protein [Leptospiraceae bacterium]|nr:gamma carbonic anhydrase family protein [Leptospiraceae bacterium]